MTEKPDQELVADDQDSVGHDIAEEDPAIDNKSTVMGDDARAITSLSWRFIVIVAALAVAGFLLYFVWVGLLPVILAILLSSVLAPVTSKLRSWKFPPALASISTLLGLLLIIVGVFTAMGPVVSRQGSQLWTQAEEGIDKLLAMSEDLPFNIDAEQIDKLVEENYASEDVQNTVREKKATIAAAVDSLKRLKEQLASVETFVNGLKAYTDGVAQAGNGASQLYDGANTLSGGMTELSDGLAELKAKLTEEGIDLLSGDVQKALDLFDNLESQMANVPSFDLVADGMAHDMLLIIRTDLQK